MPEGPSSSPEAPTVVVETSKMISSEREDVWAWNEKSEEGGVTVEEEEEEEEEE